MSTAYSPTGRLTALLALLAVCAGLIGPSARAQDEAEPITTLIAVGVTLDLPEEIEVGTIIPGTLTLQHAEGWSTWPADPARIDPDFLVEPLTLVLDDATNAWASLSDIQWPEPTARTTTDFVGDSVDVEGYTGAHEVPFALEIRAEAPNGLEAATAGFLVRFQAFDEASEGTFEVVALQTPLGSAPEEAFAVNAQFFGLTVPRTDGVLGAVLLLVFGAIGGFVLNLTPCVLPVIPLKVMTLTRHAGESRARAFYLGTWMTFGVIAFWAALGVPLAIILHHTERFVDPSTLIFSRWYITLGVGALIALMGVGIMGLFSINLPQKAYMINPSADSASGSFMFGVMAAVLGLPCFGFVVAPLLAGATAMPPTHVLAVFLGLGAGMGAPYLIFSYYPSLLNFMPKAGPASELIKQIMGLMLIAASIFFIGAGVKGVMKQHPFLDDQLMLWLIVISLAGTGLWLAYQTLKITKSPGHRAVFVLLGLFIAGAPVALAVQSGVAAKQRYDRFLEGQAIAKELGLNPYAWNDFDRDAYDTASDKGLVFVIDFTADWCINCKVLKGQVLNPDPVGEVLFGDGVIPIKADVDYADAKAFHEEQGFTGIPQLMIVGPGLERPWVSSGYTADQVLRAIEQARG